MRRMTSDERPRAGGEVVWSEGLVTRAERARRYGHEGATLWLTGIPASGKSAVGAALEAALLARGAAAYRLDGDNLRHGLNADLGFSAEDRAENVRRTGEVCALLADAGLIAIACLVSPFAADRDRVRARHQALGLRYLEVWVDAPLEVVERRDPKGLYRRARAGEITGLTGVDAPYEPPSAPDLVLRTDRDDLPTCVAALERLLEPVARRA
jgi:bifunctional enzyme CysN/CysC